MFGGANSLTHWYWPPALGDMDAISASDATTGTVRIQVARKSHTVPWYLCQHRCRLNTVFRSHTALPPFMREKRLVLLQLSECPVKTKVSLGGVRKDTHPRAHDNTGQAQDGDGVEVPLSVVSKYERWEGSSCGIRTFNSCFLPKRCISTAS